MCIRFILNVTLRRRESIHLRDVIILHFLGGNGVGIYLDSF